MAAAQPAQAAQRVPLQPWKPTFSHEDRERWVVIYPAYVNSKKSVAEGRRIAKEKPSSRYQNTKPAVDNPTYAEIRDVLNSAGCKCEVENKVYGKERDHKDLKYRGRIRVQLKDDNGAPLQENFQTRRSLYFYVAEMIPKLKSRAQGAAASSQQQSGGGAKKKGGRKK